MATSLCQRGTGTGAAARDGYRGSRGEQGSGSAGFGSGGGACRWAAWELQAQEVWPRGRRGGGASLWRTNRGADVKTGAAGKRERTAGNTAPGG